MSALLQAAEDFADELTVTVQGAVGPDVPPFVAEASPVRRGDNTRISVHPMNTELIPLRIGGEHALDLELDYVCTLDHRDHYLAVRKAHIRVLPATSGDPLFRYEFVHAMQPSLPCAHLHIHAHRDEFVYQLFRAERGKPRVRARAVTGDSDRAMPRLSDLHFPLGGPRMRPSVEDILQMLKQEFEVELAPGYQAVLDAGRARWRRHQVGAAVRDAPAEAVRVLRELGYNVAPPSNGEPAERTDRLTCM